MKKLERITKMRPAYDKRSDDPKKDYGIHCMEIHMVVKGKKGAVHFIFMTGMFLPETMEEYIKNGRAKYEVIPDSGSVYYLNKPMGVDVGYHSPTPMYDNQQSVWPTKMKKTGEGVLDIEFEKIGDKSPVCEYLGIPCYCDGSAIRGDEWLDILLHKGSDEIWKMLEDDYTSRFEL